MNVIWTDISLNCSYRINNNKRNQCLREDFKAFGDCLLIVMPFVSGYSGLGYNHL